MDNVLWGNDPGRELSNEKKAILFEIADSRRGAWRARKNTAGLLQCLVPGDGRCRWRKGKDASSSILELYVFGRLCVKQFFERQTDARVDGVLANDLSTAGARDDSAAPADEAFAGTLEPALLVDWQRPLSTMHRKILSRAVSGRSR